MIGTLLLKKQKCRKFRSQQRLHLVLHLGAQSRPDASPGPPDPRATEQLVNKATIGSSRMRMGTTTDNYNSGGGRIVQASRPMALAVSACAPRLTTTALERVESCRPRDRWLWQKAHAHHN